LVVSAKPGHKPAGPAALGDTLPIRPRARALRRAGHLASAWLARAGPPVPRALCRMHSTVQARLQAVRAAWKGTRVRSAVLTVALLAAALTCPANSAAQALPP